MVKSGEKCTIIMLYYGEYHLKLDEKGRVPIPSNFRLNKDNQKWVITKGLDGSLLLYTYERWSEVVKTLNNHLSYKNEKDRLFFRYFVFPAKEIILDKQGRLLIPKSLVSWAKIKKEVIFLGALDKIEIWSEENWEGYNKNSFDQINSILKDIPDFKF